MRPVVRDLAKRVELVPLEDTAHEPADPFLAESTSKVRGSSYLLPTRPHKGSPQNPFTWEEVGEKFRRFTASLINPTQATALIDTVQALEQVSDMAEVARLIALA